MTKSLKGYLPLSKDDVISNMDNIIASNVPLYRLKKDGKRVIVPVDRLDKYIGENLKSDITFYLSESWRSILEKGSPTIQDIPIEHGKVKGRDAKDPEPLHDHAYKDKLENIKNMSLQERYKQIQNHLYTMEKIRRGHARFNVDTITDTVNIFTDTICINKVTLEENVETPIEPEQMKNLVTRTHLLVYSLINLLKEGKTTYKELAQLQHIKTGSNSLDHMNRILFRFVSFLFFYNEYFQTNEIKKIRPIFDKKFFPYYNKLVKGEYRVNLEIVFKGGIKPIDNKKLFLEYCVGAMFHDIGKVPNLVYHDGSEIYDIVQVRKHVFDSYNSIIRSNAFTLGEAAIGLLHHEYYMSPSGYKQTSTIREKMKHKFKQQKVELPVKHFISYNIGDVIDGSAFSYFPAKLLEVLDVYDSLTDTEKQYRPKQNSVTEALTIMRNEFIEGAHLGIDPIIFNFFIDFLHLSGIIIDPSEIAHIKI